MLALLYFSDRNFLRAINFFTFRRSPTLSAEYKAGSSPVSFVAGNKKKRGRAADTAFKYNFPRRDATGANRRILPMVVVAVVQSTIRYSYVCGINNLSQFRRAAPFCGKIRAFRDRLNNDSPDWNVSRRAKSSPGGYHRPEIYTAHVCLLCVSLFLPFL